jgi:KipI family sensor histidine kinase inhibitor
MAEQFGGPHFRPVGDCGLSVEFGDRIDPAINDAVTALDRVLAEADIPGLIETVPSFRSLLIVYEPAVLPWDSLQSRLRGLLLQGTAAMPVVARRWYVPVVYAQPFGEDLVEAADLLGLTADEVVQIHTVTDFRVYMLGFQPGLPNLGGLPPALQISRRTVPRSPIPPRGVTIGGVQGAIMPMATPTGFYLLGRTPVRPFDRRRDNPALFRPGDHIRFHEIDGAEYARLEALAEAGDLLAGAWAEPL